jgi:adenylate kinase
MTSTHRPAPGARRLLVIGPQGAGKGTQAAILATRLGIAPVSTGDLFRANVGGGTELGQLAKKYMDAGDLVPDEVTIAMVSARLDEPDAKAGFLLDGFPRNAPQASALSDLLVARGEPLEAVLYLTLPDSRIVSRLAGRRVDTRNGRIYHVESDPPPAADVEAGFVVQRDDDQPEAIARRLAIFHSQTEPLVSMYADQGLLVTVDGLGEVTEVADRIAAALGA